MSLPEMSDAKERIKRREELEAKYEALKLKYEELINSVSGCYHTDEEKHKAALKYIRQSSKATW